MAVHAPIRQGTDAHLDALLADLEQEEPGMPSYTTLLQYATDEFDSVESANQEPHILDDPEVGIMCPRCVDELEEQGVEPLLESYVRKDPYLTVVTDEEDVPLRYRRDRTERHEEYIALLCPDHPDIFLAYMSKEYDDADTSVR